MMKAFDDAARDVAADVFRYLVTPTGTKIALTLNDLHGYTKRSPESVQAVLTDLGSRVPRPDSARGRRPGRESCRLAV